MHASRERGEGTTLVAPLHVSRGCRLFSPGPPLCLLIFITDVPASGPSVAPEGGFAGVGHSPSMGKRLSNLASSLAVVLTVSSCSAASNPTLQPILGNQSGTGKIRHVVYVIQENRSFNDMFEGYPGADTTATGEDSSGEKIPLRPISLKKQYDMDHSAHAMYEDCNGT